eukprot:SAG31_NODE_24519_length_479_cov_3.189474_1_plen_51_part_01
MYTRGDSTRGCTYNILQIRDIARAAKREMCAPDRPKSPTNLNDAPSGAPDT